MSLIRRTAAVVAMCVATSTVGADVSDGTTWTLGDVEAVIVRTAPGHQAEVADAIRRAGGDVASALPLVDGFAARMPASTRRALRARHDVRAVTPDSTVQFTAMTYDEASTASTFAEASGAPVAWQRGLLGDGVGVAIIDTGVSTMRDFNGKLVFGPDLSGEGRTIDSFGHGTVMAGVIGGSGFDSRDKAGGAHTGVAPNARLVSLKVAGRNGAVDVSTILEAMHWVAAYREQFNIRVLNLSWGTASTADPATDPLNYAVQRLWGLGIVVVVAAGNGGPLPGTITKPADDPAVITVGAYDDYGTATGTDDTLPTWSARGPTVHGLIKPDVVAPGRTLVSARGFGSAIEAEHPEALVAPSYIKGSGTSQAAAATSGLVALLLQARPDLTPDQVKALLTGTANPIVTALPTDQGAGRIDLAAALDAPAGPASWQQLTATGLGSIEASRGGAHVQTDCDDDGDLDVIEGEITAGCDVWSGASWTGASWTGASWTGASWTANSWSGASWTGASWTGGDWSGASWTGASWTGASWTGASWTGASWTGASWTGESWSGDDSTIPSWLSTTWTRGTRLGDPRHGGPARGSRSSFSHGRLGTDVLL